MHFLVISFLLSQRQTSGGLRIWLVLHEVTIKFCLLYEKIQPLLLSLCFSKLMFTLQSFCCLPFLLFPHFCQLLIYSLPEEQHVSGQLPSANCSTPHQFN
uniref:Uncharacterized protein n=1 Tax=Rhizophora mucronata TaxID=61149 RepID=A0A2P2MVM9_RHIMU